MKIIEILSTGWRKKLKKWTERILLQKWFDIGLRAKMSALVTVGLVGLISIFAFIAISNARQATQQLLNEHVLRTRILAESLDSSISQVAGMLTILSSHVSMDDPQASLEEWGLVIAQDFRPVQGIYLFDSSNHLLTATIGAPSIKWNEVPLIQRMDDDIARIISTDGLPRPYAVVAVPILGPNKNQPEGILAAVLDLSNPDIFISGGSLELEHGGTLQVLNSRGQVLVSTHPERSLTESTVEKITEQLFFPGPGYV